MGNDELAELVLKYPDRFPAAIANLQKWASLVREFPHRIMIGSDLCDHFDLLGKTMARYNKLLQMLDEPLQERLARTNAEEIYFG